MPSAAAARPAVVAVIVLTAITFPACRGASPSGDYDAFGGWRKLTGTKTGFFHTQKIAGKWWLVSPEGNVFFSKGVNSVHPSLLNGIADPTAEARNLHDWGMNTAGCWSDPAFRREHLAVAYRAKIVNAGAKTFPDVFDPNWKSLVERAAATECGPFRNDPWILGYFTDNERPWKHENQAAEFVQEFLTLPPTTPGYIEAQKAQRGGPSAMQKFRERAAALYFEGTAAAIHRADPNHLILGCRFAGTPPISVVRQMKGKVDVISINNYSEHPPVKLLRAMSDAADLPVMVTEFSFKAPAEGLPQNGSGPVKSTQAKRAAAYSSYVTELAAEIECVGAHWFKYAENWQGTLQSDDQPWPELTEAFVEFNPTAESRHAQGGGN